MNSFIYRLRERVWHRRPAVQSAVLAKSARMPVVPTKFGLVFGALLTVMFLWTVNHQLNLGYVLLFFAAILAVFSAAMTVGFLSQLRLRYGAAAPVFAGETAYVPLIVEETAGRPRPAFTAANRLASVECAGVEAGSSTEILLPQRMAVRGIHAAEPVEIRCSLPLQLFVAWQWLSLTGEVVVYPAPAGSQPLPVAPADSGSGLFAEGLGDDELTGLAPYQAGDPLSRVAWKQLGKNGSMTVKRFAGEGAEKVLLDYALAAGGHEARLSQLAKWICEAEAAGMFYSLKIDGAETPYLHGRSHYHACLRRLAEAA